MAPHRSRVTDSKSQQEGRGSDGRYLDQLLGFFLQIAQLISEGR